MESTRAKITRLYEEFNLESGKAEAGNKTAGRRARKISTELTKLLKAWRQESLED